jgi:ribose 5-phosphate isomerase B
VGGTVVMMRISAADEDTGVARDAVEELRRRDHQVMTHGALEPAERDDCAWA